MGATPQATPQRLKNGEPLDAIILVDDSAEQLPRLGVWDQIKDKSRMIPGVPVGEIVARGEAELGFQQFSELKPVAGIEFIGLIPEATQQVTLFSAVMVVSNARQAAAARGLIQFLASPAALDAIRLSGLEPANPGP